MRFPSIRTSSSRKNLRWLMAGRPCAAFSPCRRIRQKITLVVEELLKAGTRVENITLLCCGGLHRKNTLEEWYRYLGREIVDGFWPDRLVNHDAEAQDLRHLGTDANGDPVQCSRLVSEADLPIRDRTLRG